MIPILYPNDVKPDIEKKGIGVLVDVASCVVTEERNGIFELKMEYPVDGMYFKEITVDRLILAKPSKKGGNQLFRIYNVTKPMNGIVTVNAEHVSYMLSSILVNPFTASNPKDALYKIQTQTLMTEENPFTLTVHYEDENSLPNATMKNRLISSSRSLLGGSEGSILDVYGGEYQFDNFRVIWHKNRGEDNGVVIAYAKNLTNFKCDEKSSEIVTGAIAYWLVEDENGTIINEVYGDLVRVENGLSYSRDVAIDCSADFETEPTREQLNAKSRQYIQNRKNAPYYSITVEFVDLGDTEEYKQFKDLEQVNLCDVVTIRHPIYHVDVKEKVVKTVYDSLAEKYVKIELGSSNRAIYL
jgi:phage minor structural protein